MCNQAKRHRVSASVSLCPIERWHSAKWTSYLGGPPLKSSRFIEFHINESYLWSVLHNLDGVPDTRRRSGSRWSTCAPPYQETFYVSLCCSQVPPIEVGQFSPTKFTRPGLLQDRNCVARARPFWLDSSTMSFRWCFRDNHHRWFESCAHFIEVYEIVRRRTGDIFIDAYFLLKGHILPGRYRQALGSLFQLVYMISVYLIPFWVHNNVERAVIFNLNSYFASPIKVHKLYTHRQLNLIVAPVFTINLLFFSSSQHQHSLIKKS